MRPSIALVSSSRSLKNQPAPCGSALTTAGSSTMAWFTSTTSPASGAKTSEAAFTDSTTAAPSPFASVTPTSGNWTKTMSPSSVVACSVIPTVEMSPSSLSHSCSFVYFSKCVLLGYSAALVLRHNERKRRDGDRQAFAAHLGEDPCSGHRKRGGQV